MSADRPRLAVFNHDPEYAVEAPVEKAWRTRIGLGWVAPELDESWAEEFDVAVWHDSAEPEFKMGGQSCREYLERADAKSSHGLVCIFVSSCPEDRIPLRVQFNGGVRFLLSVRPNSPRLDASEDSPEFGEVVGKWCALFDAVLTPNCVAAWLRGESAGFEGSHRLLTTFFGDPDLGIVEWEVAATIMCEGFLAVMASVGDAAAKRALDGEIKVAGNHRKRVESPEWWKEVFGQDRPTKPHLPEGLLSAIYASGSTSGAVVGTSVVAEAYQELRGRNR